MDVPDETMITLIVKTPNLDVRDQQYECNKNWTVKSLKVFLSDVYPTKPNVEDQRLIYFGHLLSDNHLLREVLNVSDSKTHTIHLVCPASKNNFCTSENSMKHHEEISPVESNSPEVAVTPEISHSIAPGVYSRNTGPITPPTFQMPLLHSSFTGNTADFSQHAALMQQMYMQYMTQYFQYVQSTGMYVGATPNQYTTAAETTTVTTTPTIPVVQARTDPVENVQNRPVQNEAEVPVANRDMLDMLYILTRISVLLSVIYFYSSLGRCLFVIGLCCLIYMFREGLFSFRRERHHLAHPRRNASRRDPATNRNRSRTARGPSTNLNEARHRRYGQVTAVKTFVTSFFSSLIPDQPHPVNVN